MRAAEILPARFKAVADDATAAMSALGGQLMNGAFKTVEVMRDAVDHNFERLVIFIAATLARGAAVAVAVIGCFFFSIRASLRSCLAFNHTPNLEPR